MDNLNFSQTALWSASGLWIGFLISLAIFSTIVRDNIIARLAQHILVGTTLGYAAVLAWQHVLRPRLFAPLWYEPNSHFDLWLAFLLGLCLWVVGMERILNQDRDIRKGKRMAWVRHIRILGQFPITLLIGVGIAISLLGSLQGTLLPQFWQAAQTGFRWSESSAIFVSGLLTILITIGALLHLHVHNTRVLSQQPLWLRSILISWGGFGKRALWVAAGILFARLVVSRFSLFIARVAYFADTINEIGLLDWLN